MARQTPPDDDKPPDKAHAECLNIAFPTQHSTPIDQDPSSGKSPHSPVGTIAISKEELLKAQTIISLLSIGKIQVIPKSGDDSSSHDLPMTKQIGDVAPMGETSVDAHGGNNTGDLQARFDAQDIYQNIITNKDDIMG